MSGKYEINGVAYEFNRDAFHKILEKEASSRGKAPSAFRELLVKECGLSVTEKTIDNWEKKRSKPYPRNIEDICKILDYCNQAWDEVFENEDIINYRKSIRVISTLDVKMRNLKISSWYFEFLLEIMIGKTISMKNIRNMRRGNFIPDDIKAINAIEDYLLHVEKNNTSIKKEIYVEHEESNQAKIVERLLDDIIQIPLDKKYVFRFLKEYYGFNVSLVDYYKIKYMRKGLNKDFLKAISDYCEMLENSMIDFYFPVLDYENLKEDNITRGNMILAILFNDNGRRDKKRQYEYIKKQYPEDIIINTDRDFAKGDTWRGLNYALDLVYKGVAKEIAIYDLNRIKNKEVKSRFIEIANGLNIKIREVR